VGTYRYRFIAEKGFVERTISVHCRERFSVGTYRYRVHCRKDFRESVSITVPLQLFLRDRTASVSSDQKKVRCFAK